MITDEYEDIEFTSPAEAYRAAGHEVISVEKAKGNVVKGKKGGSFTIDKGIDEVSVNDFDALLIPDGFSRTCFAAMIAL